MKSLAIASLVAVASALDIPVLLSGLGPAPITDPRFHNWKAPGPDDVRSPCPGLNTLANHGFLNHDGKNITIPQLVTGGAAGLNIGPDFMSVVGALGLLSSPSPAGGSFDLDNLGEHNFPIEHDASLSRQDAYFGNWYDFNYTIWNETLQYYSNYYDNTGNDYVVTSVAEAARYHRVQECLDKNPECLYGPQQFLFSSGETGLYMQSLSQPLGPPAGEVPLVKYVRSFFEVNRLPVAEGWKPSPLPITFLSLGAYIVKLYNYQPDKAGEGIAVLEDAWPNLLVDLAGGASALSNLTQGITDYLDVPGL